MFFVYSGYTVLFFNMSLFLFFSDTSAFSEICFANVFSQSGACLSFSMALTEKIFQSEWSSEKIFILMKFSLLTYSFMYTGFGVIYKKSLPNPKL